MDPAADSSVLEYRTICCVRRKGDSENCSICVRPEVLK